MHGQAWLRTFAGRSTSCSEIAMYYISWVVNVSVHGIVARAFESRSCYISRHLYLHFVSLRIVLTPSFTLNMLLLALQLATPLRCMGLLGQSHDYNAPPFVFVSGCVIEHYLQVMSPDNNWACSGNYIKYRVNSSQELLEGFSCRSFSDSMST